MEILTLNGENYHGTITPVEARKTIFEEALGLGQSNLASITIGFNRGRVITFKLKQQIDIDQLYEKEYFEFERSMGEEICVIACKIRGVRNPANRPAATFRAAPRVTTVPPLMMAPGSFELLAVSTGCLNLKF